MANYRRGNLAHFADKASEVVENQGLVGRRLEIPQVDRQGACRLWIVIVDIGEAEVVDVDMCWHGVESCRWSAATLEGFSRKIRRAICLGRSFSKPQRSLNAI